MLGSRDAKAAGTGRCFSRRRLSEIEEAKTEASPAPLPETTWRSLMDLKGDALTDAPVFPSKSGKPLDRSRVLRIVKDAVRAGVNPNATTHWLRHAHASHALDRGAPIHLVEATLGHASIAATSRYLHARPGDSSARFIAGF